jgi:hypothetical protein
VREIPDATAEIALATKRTNLRLSASSSITLCMVRMIRQAYPMTETIEMYQISLNLKSLIAIPCHPHFVYESSGPETTTDSRAIVNGNKQKAISCIPGFLRREIQHHEKNDDVNDRKIIDAIGNNVMIGYQS